MQINAIVIIFGYILFDCLSEEPRLLTETLKQDDLILDHKIIFPDRKWIIRIEKSNLSFDELGCSFPLNFISW